VVLWNQKGHQFLFLLSFLYVFVSFLISSFYFFTSFFLLSAYLLQFSLISNVSLHLLKSNTVNTSKGKVVPVLNSLSTTPWRRMLEWMYRSDSSWRGVVNFTPRPLYLRYPLDRRLGGPQIRPGWRGEENILTALYENTLKRIDHLVELNADGRIVLNWA
jgi:hypothetical protein